jgi:hypothetical protein
MRVTAWPSTHSAFTRAMDVLNCAANFASELGGQPHAPTARHSARSAGEKDMLASICAERGPGEVGRGPAPPEL